MPKHEDEVELAASVDGLARSRFWLEMTKLCDELSQMHDNEITPRELSGIILKLANEVLLITRKPETRPAGPSRKLDELAYPCEHGHVKALCNICIPISWV